MGLTDRQIHLILNLWKLGSCSRFQTLFILGPILLLAKSEVKQSCELWGWPKLRINYFFSWLVESYLNYASSSSETDVFLEAVVEERFSVFWVAENLCPYKDQVNSFIWFTQKTHRKHGHFFILTGEKGSRLLLPTYGMKDALHLNWALSGVCQLPPRAAASETGEIRFVFLMIRNPALVPRSFWDKLC